MEQARNALSLVEQAINAGWTYLNSQCAEGGRVSATKADQHQLASFDLAFCTAESIAAQHVLEYAEAAAAAHSGAELETRLALTFTADAINNIRTRIAARPGDYGLSDDVVHNTLESKDVEAFMHTQLAAAELESLGAMVLDRDGALGVSMLDDEKELIRDTFNKFATEVVMPRAEHIHREDQLVPDEILQELIDMGCFGLSIPARYDGLQPDDAEDSLGMIVTTEELSRGSLAAAGSLITRPEIMSRALLKGGTEAQKAHWLPKIAMGDPLVGICFTEPNFGSDVAGMQFKATKVDGGWSLTGSKTWCTFAGKAGVLLTLARTDPDMSKGHKGLSMLMVEKPSFDGHEFEHRQDGGGAMKGKAIATIGYRGMHSFDVFFDDYFVPDDNLLGGEDGLGKGFYFTMAGMSGGRIQTSARANGVMRAAFERAVSYSGERKVFGEPLGAYQLTKTKIARMAATLCASREFSYAVARQMDAGGGQMESSLVKLFACKSAQWVTSEALQIHGGMGYAEETAVSRYFLDARVLPIFEGAEETLALKVVARTLIEQAS